MATKKQIAEATAKFNTIINEVTEGTVNSAVISWVELKMIETLEIKTDFQVSVRDNEVENSYHYLSLSGDISNMLMAATIAELNAVDLVAVNKFRKEHGMSEIGSKNVLAYFTSLLMRSSVRYVLNKSGTLTGFVNLGGNRRTEV